MESAVQVVCLRVPLVINTPTLTVHDLLDGQFLEFALYSALSDNPRLETHTHLVRELVHLNKARNTPVLQKIRLPWITSALYYHLIDFPFLSVPDRRIITPYSRILEYMDR